MIHFQINSFDEIPEKDWLKEDENLLQLKTLQTE
jgi:hypothetical protein